MENLALMTFKILRNLFFDEVGNPVCFTLREKRNTQDDPFDEYLASALAQALPHYGAGCQKSSGPLISPDMAVYNLLLTHQDDNIENNPDKIIGIEVKSSNVERMEGLLEQQD